MLRKGGKKPLVLNKDMAAADRTLFDACKVEVNVNILLGYCCAIWGEKNGHAFDLSSEARRGFLSRVEGQSSERREDERQGGEWAKTPLSTYD